MCWFLTIGVRDGGTAAIEKLGRQRAGLGINRSRNRALAAIFPQGDTLFDVTLGGCSCGVYRFLEAEDPQAEAKFRIRHRRKGWSEPKIDRAFDAHRNARLADNRQRPGPVPTLRMIVDEQLHLCTDIHLFMRFCEGSPENDVINSRGARALSMNGFIRGELRSDELVTVRRAVAATR